MWPAAVIGLEARGVNWAQTVTALLPLLPPKLFSLNGTFQPLIVSGATYLRAFVLVIHHTCISKIRLVTSPMCFVTSTMGIVTLVIGVVTL